MEAHQARDTARRLVAAARAREPELFRVDGLDIAPAIEQALFGRLRRDYPVDDPSPICSRLRSVARLLAHAAAAALPHEGPEAGHVVVVLLTPSQARILDSFRDRLEAGGMRIFHLFESHIRSGAARVPHSARLIDQLDLGRAAHLLRFELRLAMRLRSASRDFAAVVEPVAAGRMRRALAEAIGRIALYAACLDAVAERRPALMATFNEIGRWSRLLPEAARHHGVPSLDIPHAEAADEVAIQGVAYDRLAVFGSRAAQVVERAGVPADRIVAVGAPRFDALIHRHASRARVPPERRIVFASQWLTGDMTADVKRRTLDIALRAAAAVAPCEFVIRPHPIERDQVIADVLRSGVPAGVHAHVQMNDLYDMLDGAWLLVTGWSNAVFEATLSGVPSLCVLATGKPLPTAFVEDGIALGAQDDATAAAVVRGLLDAGRWLAAVASAREALTDHLGPLDGRAGERIVDLIMSMTSDAAVQRRRTGP